MYHSWWRFVFLGLWWFVLVGNYFNYDNPAPLMRELRLPVSQGGMGMSYLQFNLLYSLYSFPNFVLPFVGGMIVDKFIGKRMGIIIFTLILAIG